MLTEHWFLCLGGFYAKALLYNAATILFKYFGYVIEETILKCWNLKVDIIAFALWSEYGFGVEQIERSNIAVLESFMDHLLSMIIHMLLMWSWTSNEYWNSSWSLQPYDGVCQQENERR